VQNPIDSPYLVPFDGSFHVAGAPTAPGEDAPGKKANRKHLKELRERLSDLQRTLYAQDRISLLLVFQAMDAAGKDGTVRAVMEGVNPTGCQVFSFKQPSALELDHDFLWRTSKRLPERGRIGIFNRSYYEEVLVVRVHPEYLAAQRLPGAADPTGADLDRLWKERYESIRDHERHLVRNGTVILKFWLNVSKAEQRERFLARLDEPQKHWKFSAGDVRERQSFDAYMSAYEDALNATSCPQAPWYAIPADDKPFMRTCVADLIVRRLESLGLHYPRVTRETKATFEEMRHRLESES